MHYKPTREDFDRITAIISAAQGACRHASETTMDVAVKMAKRHAETIWNADDAFQLEAACEELEIIPRLAPVFEGRGLFLDYNSTDERRVRSQQHAEDTEKMLAALLD